MGFVSKTVLALSSLLVVYTASGAVYYGFGNGQFESYVESNLSKIAQLQETKLGIKHSFLPRVESVRAPFAVVAEYYTTRKTIRLTPVMYNSGKGLEGILNNIFVFGARRDPGRIPQDLAHELGHAYAEELVKEFWDKWRKEVLFGNTNPMAFKVISEGIAMYFELKTFDKVLDVERIRWPSSRAEYKYGSEYDYGNVHEIGYRLCKPIIEQFGVKGIRYLLLNPPNNEDLAKLPNYQQRVLATLSK